MSLLDPAENVALIEAAARLSDSPLNDDSADGGGGVDKETRDDARTFLRRMWSAATIEPEADPAETPDDGDGADS